MLPHFFVARPTGMAVLTYIENGRHFWTHPWHYYWIYEVFKVFADREPGKDAKPRWNSEDISYHLHVSHMTDPRSACPFQPRWNSSGGGAATRALGPITSSFIGSAKQHQGGFSMAPMHCQRRPCTARKMLACLLLTLSAIWILCFFFSSSPPKSKTPRLRAITEMNSAPS